MHGKGACVAGGGHGRRGACMTRGGVRGRRDGHCSGRCVSYWNAFLLYFRITIGSQSTIYCNRSNRHERIMKIIKKCKGLHKGDL